MARQNFQVPTQLPESGFTISPTIPDDNLLQNSPAAKTEVQSETANGTPVQKLQGGTTIVDVDLNNNDNNLRVTGWLVCTKGCVVGRDFRLHNGWNYIGRDESLDINLNDQRVDRRPMVKVAYDDRSRSFTIAPCEGAKNLAYLNGGALFGPAQFKAYDRLQIGESVLMLVPLCSSEFTWNEEE